MWLCVASLLRQDVSRILCAASPALPELKQVRN